MTYVLIGITWRYKNKLGGRARFQRMKSNETILLCNSRPESQCTNDLGCLVYISNPKMYVSKTKLTLSIPFVNQNVKIKCR